MIDDPWRAPSATTTEWQAYVGPAPTPRANAARLVADEVRSHGRTALTAVAAVVLLGAPAGLLWSAVSPEVDNIDGSSKALFAADGVFLLIALALGAACGSVAWAAARRAGPLVPVALAVGGGLASLVAREVGGRVVVNDRLADACGRAVAELREICAIYDGTLRIRAGAVLLAWSVAAVLALLVCVMLFDRDAAG